MRALGFSVVTAAALAAVTAAGTGLTGQAHAAPASQAALDPVQVPSLTTMLDGFHWGMTHSDVVTMFTKVGGIIDKDYDPLLRKVQPGVQMNALEADRDNKKAAIERSYLTFNFPTGYDSTGLKSEYSYKNNESLLYVERQGKRRYFFFIGAAPTERLWKIYDEIPLGDGAPLGKTYAEAVTRLQGALGVVGRSRAANKDAGLDFTTVDWQDGITHLRIVDRSKENLVGVALEERATWNALPQLRSHKEEDPMAIDPSIAAITKSSISDPNNARQTPDAGAPTKKRK
jgi:hypothetical protein